MEWFVKGLAFSRPKGGYGRTYLTERKAKNIEKIHLGTNKTLPRSL